MNVTTITFMQFHHKEMIFCSIKVLNNTSTFKIEIKSLLLFFNIKNILIVFLSSLSGLAELSFLTNC